MRRSGKTPRGHARTRQEIILWGMVDSKQRQRKRKRIATTLRRWVRTEHIIFLSCDVNSRTYSIGKERVVKGKRQKATPLHWLIISGAIARALRSKIYCDARKTAILRCQDDPDLHSMITNQPLEASVHLVPLGTIASDRLKDYLDRYQGTFTKVIGFRPTGWTYVLHQPNFQNTKAMCQIHTTGRRRCIPLNFDCGGEGSEKRIRPPRSTTFSKVDCRDTDLSCAILRALFFLRANVLRPFVQLDEDDCHCKRRKRVQSQ